MPGYGKFLVQIQKAWHRENLLASQLIGSQVIVVSLSIESSAGQLRCNREERRDPHINLAEIRVCFIEIGEAFLMATCQEAELYSSKSGCNHFQADNS